MTQSHTPGPWKWVKNPNCPRYFELKSDLEKAKGE
jgi:hypothetical protein